MSLDSLLQFDEVPAFTFKNGFIHFASPRTSLNSLISHQRRAQTAVALNMRISVPMSPPTSPPMSPGRFSPMTSPFNRKTNTTFGSPMSTRGCFDSPTSPLSPNSFMLSPKNKSKKATKSSALKSMLISSNQFSGVESEFPLTCFSELFAVDETAEVKPLAEESTCDGSSTSSGDTELAVKDSSPISAWSKPWEEQSEGSSDLLQKADKQKKKRRQNKYVCDFIIGIQETPEFSVRKKLLGPGGKFMKCITSRCNKTASGANDSLRIRLRGVGSGFHEHGLNQESSEPLQLSISGLDYRTYARAKQDVSNLISKMYKEYAEKTGISMKINCVEAN